jgi:hypothetical protein
MQMNHAIFMGRAREENQRRAKGAAKNWRPLMILNNMISRTKDRIAKRRRYNELVTEILSLSDRDLADMNGNRTEMLRQVRQQIYG